MTLEQKLYSILTGSPAPVPAMGSALYLAAAPQRTAYPYVVYQMISRSDLQTQEGTDNLRTWVYQFKCYAQDALTARTILLALAAVLIPYSDRPAAGIENVTPLGMRDVEFVEADRGFGVAFDFQIVERLA